MLGDGGSYLVKVCPSVISGSSRPGSGAVSSRLFCSTPSAAVPPHRPRPPPDRTGGSWGRRFQRQGKSRPQGAAAFPTSPPQPPAGRSVPACRTGTQQQVGQVSDYQLFHFRLHRDSPLSLIFSLACWLLLAAAFSFRTARVFRMEGVPAV